MKTLVVWCLLLAFQSVAVAKGKLQTLGGVLLGRTNTVQMGLAKTMVINLVKTGNSTALVEASNFDKDVMVTAGEAFIEGKLNRDQIFELITAHGQVAYEQTKEAYQDGELTEEQYNNSMRELTRIRKIEERLKGKIEALDKPTLTREDREKAFNEVREAFGIRSSWWR